MALHTQVPYLLITPPLARKGWMNQGASVRVIVPSARVGLHGLHSDLGSPLVSD